MKLSSRSILRSLWKVACVSLEAGHDGHSSDLISYRVDGQGGWCYQRKLLFCSCSELICKLNN